MFKFDSTKISHQKIQIRLRLEKKKSNEELTRMQNIPCVCLRRRVVQKGISAWADIEQTHKQTTGIYQSYQNAHHTLLGLYDTIDGRKERKENKI